LAPAHSSRKAAGKMARHSILCVDLPKRGVKKWGSSQVRSQNASVKMERPRDADACTVGIARQCRGRKACSNQFVGKRKRGVLGIHIVDWHRNGVVKMHFEKPSLLFIGHNEEARMMRTVPLVAMLLLASVGTGHCRRCELLVVAVLAVTLSFSHAWTSALTHSPSRSVSLSLSRLRAICLPDTPALSIFRA